MFDSSLRVMMVTEIFTQILTRGGYHAHIISPQRCRSRALKVSKCLVVIGLRPQFRITRIRQSILALEQQKRCRSSNLIQTLFTFELKLSAGSSFSCSEYSSSGCFHCLSS